MKLIVLRKIIRIKFIYNLGPHLKNAGLGRLRRPEPAGGYSSPPRAQDSIIARIRQSYLLSKSSGSSR
jgi:hypothetical protein